VFYTELFPFVDTTKCDRLYY